MLKRIREVGIWWTPIPGTAQESFFNDDTPEAALLLSGGWGTGKTMTLTGKMLKLSAINAPLPVVWQTVLAIGGPGGWGTFEPAWRLRGRLDQVVGGPGMRGRPRRRLRVGDAVDLWRVDELTSGASSAGSSVSVLTGAA